MSFKTLFSLSMAVCVVALAVVSGCGREGPPMGTVSGTVTLDGKPAPGVIVEFTPIEQRGAPSYGRTDENGYYELRFSATRDGAFLGKHRVRIQADEPEDEQGNPLPQKLVLPAKYATKSELTFIVNEGDNRADFPLESERSS